METKLPEWDLCQCIDIPDYPLKNTMTATEIKAVSGSEVLKGAMKVAAILEKRYEGTPWYLDMSLSTKVLTFITLLKHTGGSLGGTPFRLLPFQAEFVLQSLCVMARDTGFRKHKECIMSIPRKNGKTEQGAGFNLMDAVRGWGASERALFHSFRDAAGSYPVWSYPANAEEHPGTTEKIQDLPGGKEDHLQLQRLRGSLPSAICCCRDQRWTQDFNSICR